MRQAQQFEWLLNGSRARHSSLSERHLSLHYSRCILGTLPLLTAAEILSAIQILWKITHATLLYWSSSVVLNLFVYHNSRNTLASGCFRGFSEKKCLNARGFAWEYLRSCMGYTPGQSVKRCSKSSNLQSKKNFCLRCVGFFVTDVINGGLLGHLGPLCLAPGANCYVVIFCWSFYWKLGYNPSLLILWMTCWVSGSKIMV